MVAITILGGDVDAGRRGVAHKHPLRRAHVAARLLCAEAIASQPAGTSAVAGFVQK